MLKVLLLILGATLIQGTKVGPLINVFTTLHDNVLVVDRHFFLNEENSLQCGEFQIFCDWFFTDFKNQNNQGPFKNELLNILKSPEYMVFFKDPQLNPNQPRGTRRCSGNAAVCANLDKHRKKRAIDKISETLKNRL